MPFDLPAGILIPSGLSAIVGLCITLILTGRLVPASVLKELVMSKDAALSEKAKEAEYWRQAFFAADAQINHLLKGNQVAVDVLDTLRTAAK